MHDPHGKPDGIFSPEEEVEEMAEELKRRETPSISREDREELAASIVRRKHHEHELADHENQQRPSESRPRAEINEVVSMCLPTAYGGPEIDPETPYAIEELAEKYGLTYRAAEVVLMANGPSRRKSDIGAAAFLAAIAAYRARRKGA